MHDALVRVELNVDDLLMVSGKYNFYRGVIGGKHGVFLGVCQRNDKSWSSVRKYSFGGVR